MTHTPESRARISAALKGRTRPPEVRARIAATMTGRRASEETRAKISAAAKARGHFARCWRDPEFIEAHRERSRERMVRRHREDPEFHERAKERLLRYKRGATP